MAKTTEETTAPEAAQVAEGSIEHIKTLNLWERLLLIEEAIGTVQKTGTNEAQGGWKFMEHAAIAAALKPLFIKYRVKYMYSEESNEITPQQGWDKDAKQVVPRGAKSHKKVRHELVNIDDTDERELGYTFTEANSTSDKASNASSTYAQKLFYLRTFNLSDVDPDAEALEATPEVPKAKISKSRETDIYTMLEKIGVTAEDYEAGLSKKYGNGKEVKVTDLTNAQATAEIQNMVAYIQRQRVSAGE